MKTQAGKCVYFHGLIQCFSSGDGLTFYLLSGVGLFYFSVQRKARDQALFQRRVGAQIHNKGKVA